MVFEKTIWTEVFFNFFFEIEKKRETHKKIAQIEGAEKTRSVFFFDKVVVFYGQYLSEAKVWEVQKISQSSTIHAGSKFI